MRREQQLRIRTERRVDWPQIITDLRGRGYTITAIAMRLRIPRTTIRGWADIDCEPRHADGERLIALWCASTGMERGQLPLANVTGWLP